MIFTEGRPIYLQIVDMIAEKILRETLVEGDRLESVRDMAVRITVNPNTVVRAYAYLESQGIITMQRGIGYFVTEHGYDIVLKLKQKEFYQIEAPHFLKKMELLNIPFSALKKLILK